MDQPNRAKLHRLEAIRGFAAIYVFFCHARPVDHGIIGFAGRFGQEAVILFFVLSGFVICYSTQRASGNPSPAGIARPTSFRNYFLRRFRRIYPLFCVALLVSYLLACLIAGHWLSPQLRQLAGNLLMLQDTAGLKRGVWFDTYFGDSALWSLSYEWWFYMLFFAVVFTARWTESRQKYAVFAASWAAGVLFQFWPNPPALYLSEFYIWWTGVELAREFLATGRVSIRRQAVSLLLLSCFVPIWLAAILHARHRGVPLNFTIDPVVPLLHVAGAVAALIVGLIWYRLSFIAFDWILGPFAVFAPFSYALYVLHEPTLQALSALLPLQHGAIFPIALLILIPVCYLLEVKLQPMINRLFARLENRPPSERPRDVKQAAQLTPP